MQEYCIFWLFHLPPYWVEYVRSLFIWLFMLLWRLTTERPLLIVAERSLGSGDTQKFHFVWLSGQEVMIEELLRRFAQENFHGADYVPLLHGHLATTKPLSLIIRRKRPLWKIPFARAEIIILAGLEKYVSSDSERKYQEAVQKNVVQEQVMEKDKSDPAQW